MTLSVGTLLQNLGYAQATDHTAQQGSQGDSLTLSTNPSSLFQTSSGDSLDLSSQAQNLVTSSGFEALQTIERGIQNLQQADLNLARQRLGALRERVDYSNNLLAGASSDTQRNSIVSDAQNLGRELGSIVSQIQDLIGASVEYEAFSLQISTTSVAAEFNALSYSESSRFNGGGVSYAQSLNTEFSSLNLSASQSTLTITGDESGNISIERTSQQVELVAQQLSRDYSQTLSAAGTRPLAGDDVSALLDDFYQTAQGYDSFANNLLEAFKAQSEDVDAFADKLLSHSHALAA